MIDEEYARIRRLYARWCARAVLHLWDAPEVVRAWLDTGDEARMEEALSLSRRAAGVSWRGERLVEIDEDTPWEIVVTHNAAASAMYSAAREEPCIPVADIAKWAQERARDAWVEADEGVEAPRAAYLAAAYAAEEASEEATGGWQEGPGHDAMAESERIGSLEVHEEAVDAAWEAVDAAWEALEAAKVAPSDQWGDFSGAVLRLLPEIWEDSPPWPMSGLPDLLRTHGLAARLLDEVRADPWLTREIVRALGLPDLAVWVDWCKQMTEESP